MGAIEWSANERRWRVELDYLSKKFTDLYLEHQHMVVTIKPKLEALYLKTLGNLQYEQLKLELDVKLLKLKKDLLQSYINRDEAPNLEVVKEELLEYERLANRTLNEKGRELINAELYLESPTLSFEDTKKLKQLYNKIVKAVHPDLHSNATEEMIVVFLRATDLYKQANLEGLQNLYECYKLSLEVDPELVDNVEQEVEQLREKVKQLEEKINALWATFPFIHAANLENEEWVTEQTTLLEERITALQAERERLMEVVSLMEEFKIN